jgi:hypothetical protein
LYKYSYKNSALAYTYFLEDLLIDDLLLCAVCMHNRQLHCTCSAEEQTIKGGNITPELIHLLEENGGLAESQFRSVP